MEEAVPAGEDFKESKDEFPVLHVVLVGFHHKKGKVLSSLIEFWLTNYGISLTGCMVEYAYPPLLPEGEGHSSELPSQWKHLPSLAMPDGSHNYEADTAFFHLPDLEDPRKTIFGISCYRQIGEKQKML